MQFGNSCVSGLQTVAIIQVYLQPKLFCLSYSVCLLITIHEPQGIGKVYDPGRNKRRMLGVYAKSI